MPADLVVQGKIASLEGDDGFGWVEAIAISDGRVVAAGRIADVDGLVGRATRRLTIPPDEVVLPGLTDAHLHLIDAALAARQVDLVGTSLAEGLARIAAAHDRLLDDSVWLLGGGWDPGRWGRWPTARELEHSAPGRPAVLWSHDHHAVWANDTALARAGIDGTTPDLPGGVIKRLPDGEPEGTLLETATQLVTPHIPPPPPSYLEDALVEMSARLLGLGIVALHDPGGLSTDQGFEVYGRLADRGSLPLRVHASVRQHSLAKVASLGLGSGDPLGADPATRARMGWLKLFADGALGSRTAALLEPYEDDARGGELPAGPLGILTTDPFELGRLAEEAAAARITSQIHAIGDAAVRVALDALAPTVGRTTLMPRLEHIQLLHPDDLPRFAELGVAASVQPVHLRSDADGARLAWGTRAERYGYAYGSLAASGTLLAFGSDAPVEEPDPWPGLEMAVTRRDASWLVDAAFGPDQRLSLAQALRAACVGPALVAAESDRGRLVVGHRADLVVIQADSVAEPVVAGGPLGSARPRLVLIDGRVAFEA